MITVEPNKVQVDSLTPYDSLEAMILMEQQGEPMYLVAILALALIVILSILAFGIWFDNDDNSNDE